MLCLNYIHFNNLPCPFLFFSLSKHRNTRTITGKSHLKLRFRTKTKIKGIKVRAKATCSGRFSVFTFEQKRKKHVGRCLLFSHQRDRPRSRLCLLLALFSMALGYPQYHKVGLTMVQYRQTFLVVLFIIEQCNYRARAVTNS